MSETELEGFTNEALNAQADAGEPQGEHTPEPQPNLDDPAVHQQVLEEKFGGDVDAAMKSYVHLQAKLDEQGSELGETRKENSEIKQQLNQLAATLDERLPPDDGFDHYETPSEDQVYEDPARAAEQAYLAGDREGVRKALDAWEEVSPMRAAVWFNEKRMAEVQAQQSQMFEARMQPQEQRTQAAVVQEAYSDLTSKYGEDFDNFFRSDASKEVLGSLPAELKGATEEVMRGGDKSAIASALEYVYNAGKGRAGAAPAADGSGNPREPAPQAAVLGQELGSPTGGQPQQSEMDQIQARISSQVLGGGEVPDELAFVSAANELRANRNLQY